MLRFVQAVAIAALLTSAAGPSQAFEIFGITIFGEEEEDVQVEIIDPQPYTVAFDVAGEEDGLARILRRSSALWTRRDDPASGAAGLIATARNDYRSLLAALYSEARYGAAISIRINGAEAASMPLTTTLTGTARVTVSVDPGPSFAFGRAEFLNPPPRGTVATDPAAPTALELFQSGNRALSDVVSAAGDEAVQGWRRAGYPKARVAGREVIADHGTDRLDATIRMDPGPAARFGRVSVSGSNAVDPDFVRYMADIPVGDRFDPDAIDKGIERLNNLRVFRSVRIAEAEQVAPDGTLPLTVETLPRLPRRYGFGATLSSTEGLGLEGYWLHRNLFGRAERLRFDASISGIGSESRPENYDYELGVSFTRPGLLNPDTDFETGLTLAQNVFDTYTEQRAAARVGLSRRFSDRLTGTAFLEAAYSEVTDDLGRREFLSFALPVTAAYDRRDDPLDATRGYFVSGEIRPFHETQFATTAARAVIEGRTYFGFSENRTVLAFRGRYGTVLGGELDEIPPDQLFFTGGGGSVRGFAFRSNGLEIDGETVGGRSSIELSGEVRQRLNRRFGLVAFTDAGLVSEETFPGGETDWRVGAGLGARFYTGIGPIRLDIATPVDRQEGDDYVAFYVGIGQAF